MYIYASENQTFVFILIFSLPPVTEKHFIKGSDYIYTESGHGRLIILENVLFLLNKIQEAANYCRFFFIIFSLSN